MEVKNSGFDTSLRKFRVSNKVCMWQATYKLAASVPHPLVLPEHLYSYLFYLLWVCQIDYLKQEFYQ